MHGNFPFMFDHCANPVVHLLLVKSFMSKLSYFSTVESISATPNPVCVV